MCPASRGSAARDRPIEGHQQVTERACIRQTDLASDPLPVGPRHMRVGSEEILRGVSPPHPNVPRGCAADSGECHLQTPLRDRYCSRESRDRESPVVQLAPDHPPSIDDETPIRRADPCGQIVIGVLEKIGGESLDGDDEPSAHTPARLVETSEDLVDEYREQSNGPDSPGDERGIVEQLGSYSTA